MESRELPVAGTTEAVATRDREIASRRAAIAAELSRNSHDALLFTREANVTYLCGYTTATWSNFSRPVVGLLSASGELAMVVAETEADAVHERVSDAAVEAYVELRPVREAHFGLPDGRVQFAPHAAETLSAVLRRWGVGKLMVDGLAGAFPPIAQLTGLLDAGELRLSDASPLLWRQRLRKSDWKVERLRESCSVLERGFDALEAELRPGMTEREIHGCLAAGIFRAGADALGYTNVVAGVRRGLFGAPTDREWRPGEVLYVDGGAVLDGYWADFCRMYVAAEPTAAQADGYGRAVGALDAAFATLQRPDLAAGTLASTIAAAGGLSPSDTGFGRFGHGIGLYMPEPPSVHPLDDTPLAAGTVMCVEPAIEHLGANYVVEEQCVIRDGGVERLSPPAPRTLIAVQ